MESHRIRRCREIRKEEVEVEKKLGKGGHASDATRQNSIYFGLAYITGLATVATQAKTVNTLLTYQSTSNVPNF